HKAGGNVAALLPAERQRQHRAGAGQGKAAVGVFQNDVELIGLLVALFRERQRDETRAQFSGQVRAFQRHAPVGHVVAVVVHAVASASPSASSTRSRSKAKSMRRGQPSSWKATWRASSAVMT